MRVVRRNVSPTYDEAAVPTRVPAGRRGREAHLSPPGMHVAAVEPRDRG